MATDFKYASQSDMNRYVGDIVADADSKRQVYGWSLLSSNKYVADNTGLITQLFMDGADLGAVASSAGDVDSNYKWYYLASDDRVYLYNDASDPNDLIMEAGFDNATYYDQMLVDASMELNNLLDARFPTPVKKVIQIDENTLSNSGSIEYDAIIIKMTCYVCASNILRANGETEQADYYYSQVTNVDRTGMVDRLNAGEFKLSFEIDSQDSKGKITYKQVGGSMDIVELVGEYSGHPYDLIKITATEAGVFGTCKIVVNYMTDTLQDTQTENQDVTGGVDYLTGMGGLGVRFGGNLMGDGDDWEIEVTSEGRKISNPMTSGIELTRGSRGY